jgi:hypothetical protein
MVDIWYNKITKKMRKVKLNNYFTLSHQFNIYWNAKNKIRHCQAKYIKYLIKIICLIFYY